MARPDKIKAKNIQRLHPRNLHSGQYDFENLCTALPELLPFVFTNEYGSRTINFADPLAVKLLNKALLKFYYHMDFWDIPQGYLCPPIPGRADYIHYLADLLSFHNQGVIPNGDAIHILDVGVGSNAVYPIVGIKEYGWRFTGSEIDAGALKNIAALQEKNEFLHDKLKTIAQKNTLAIFEGIVGPDDFFYASMCNPPFHSSAEEAAAGSLRKARNLTGKPKSKPLLNFAGRQNELWCIGGELAFIKKMVEESILFKNNIFWFTTLVAKSTHLPEIIYLLKNAKASDVRTIEMRQGQKISRCIAWTFLDGQAFRQRIP